MKSEYLIFGNLCMILFCFILGSCTYILLGEKSLGQGYYFTNDGAFSEVIISATKHYKGAGLVIIPPTVINVNSDKKTIIAQSVGNISTEKYYWIINKENPIDLDACIDPVSCDSTLRSNVEGPLDSMTFYQLLENRSIDLKFK
jgi:hypothetical protein